ncbi:ribonuclease J [Nitratifractor salsuginis]|uniref:Ribonuclease J n=1 Tax=Nitratifractor salsuginis (strain DSM 16511 / JCM 12458 / E9I37-1) TaxID=749222 RepID=E6WY85_NITSE|nr:ribonuclease J [Nitratifractor salsuginis]ADV45333.1 RNA-metabolising metallo-beta-lactamase [Nitratifractor salsuginis DSM 16511]
MEKNQNPSTENQNKNNSGNRSRRRPNPFRNNKKTEGKSAGAASEAPRKENNNQGERSNGGENKSRNEGNRRNNNNNRNRNQSNRNQNQNRSNGNGGGRGRGSRRPKIDTTVPADMKAAILENERVQQERMNPWKQIDMGAKGKLRFTPLGGLGEIGGNIAVLETEKDAIIIDVGMSFPDETMHGVDILVPDFSYLHAIKDKIRAIVITHAHEDHIGAVPYLFKELKFPIYGTPLALAMIGNKFDEHGLQADKKYFRYVVKRKIYDIGEFKIEWMHMTHSIVDSSSLAIQTPIGTLIHTADFKIDHTPIDGYTADLHRFAHYGAQGVLCLFSDSTNSHNPGFTKSEAVVGKTFDKLFEMAKGRVIMSTFSSNAHRIFQAIERGVKHGRKICVIGRSMERNIETVRRLGYIDVDDKHFIEAHEVGKYKDSEILVVTTGSQGETMAALSRMATDEHRHIKLKPTDTVIISASAIPGNEASVSKLLNLLLKAGVTVRYKECSDIHVSGHASQEEQKLILRLVQPKFFLPVHGEYNHIAAHARTAASCGVDERNMLLMSDGDQIEITTKYIKKVKTVKTGKRYIDNQNNKEIYADVVDDRQKLSTEGVVNIVAKISTQTGRMVDHPIVTSYGLVPDREDKQFAKEIEQLIESYLVNNKVDPTVSNKVIEDDLRGVVRKHILKRYKKYPIIIPAVFLV